MKRIITIDGPAGSGKSTIAKLLANRIDFTYIDTGAIYRALTYYLLSQKITEKEPYKIAHELEKVKLDYEKDSIKINGQEVSSFIRTEEVTKSVPLFAQNAEIRKFVKTIQHKLGNKGECVIDGRDIGTVVFKDAFCKFYLDAKPAVRAERRLGDVDLPEGKSKEEIASEMKKRDEMDRNRALSPLKIAPDACVIDSTNLSPDDVMEKMVEHFNKKNAMAYEHNYAVSNQDSQMFLNALENFSPDDGKERGSLVKGKIISVTNGEIYLDINDKRDGIIPEDEARKLDQEQIKPGNEIDVYIVNTNPKKPQIRVSKLEAEKRSALIEIRECFNNNRTIEGTVLYDVKGGFIVDIKGNQTFCPYSEFDVRKVNKNKQNGLTDQFYILEYTNQKIVVSRKKYLEEKYGKIKENFFAAIQEGDFLEGKVVNVTGFGVFVEVEEGITGIVRLKNLSWKRVDDPAEIVNRGDPIKVKIVGMDRVNFKLELSKKAAEEDPITDFVSKYQVGDIVKGEVRHIEKFGAFIEVAEGLEGLLHVSEMSWTKKVHDPKEILHKGDFVETKLLSVDVENRKVSLGLKQVVSNPWDTIEQRFPVGDIVQVTVKSIIPNGVYCSIDDDFEGFVHVENVTWSTDRVNLKREFKKDDVIEAKIIGYSKPKRRIELGLKQKSSNPWEDLRVNYGVGGTILGEVTRLIDSGAFVRLSDEIEGFCHVSQLAPHRVEKPSDVLNVGDKMNFYIQLIDEENKKVSLSIKKQKKAEEKKDIEQYISNEKGDKTFTIAELLNS